MHYKPCLSILPISWLLTLGYLWGVRKAWSWYFGVLFELDLYALSLERTLRDFSHLCPLPSPGASAPPQPTPGEQSYIAFLFMDMQGRFDATCESILWHFLQTRLPVWTVLLPPAVSNRLRE